MRLDAGLQHGANRHHPGLRYLHCNLCETEWHVVRVKCSNCEQTRDLHYWSLENEEAAVKAESCGDCGTYLKILYQEKDPKVEAVADDLASLVLDARWSRRASPAARSTRSCSR
jgi:FdhE protein